MEKSKEFLKKVLTKGTRENEILNEFHKLYYDSYKVSGTWSNTFWLGIPTQKYPTDLWEYQEIMNEIKPDLIIETGTYKGGSALYLASICELLKKGEIISIDINKDANLPKHKRITYLTGSSTSDEILNKLRKKIKPRDKVLVILDSDHNKNHVLNELRIYSQLVTKGSYMILEDTNINGHPAFPDFGDGPMEALKEFVEENRNFVIDRSREKFYLSANPKGYLKKIV